MLLEQARGESEHRKNAMARYGLLFYRFPELKQFKLWQRDVITRGCISLVHREPVTVTRYAAWLLFVLAVVFFHPSPVLGVSLGGLGVLGDWLLLAFHTWRVRRYVRTFLAFMPKCR